MATTDTSVEETLQRKLQNFYLNGVKPIGQNTKGKVRSLKTPSETLSKFNEYIEKNDPEYLKVFTELTKRKTWKTTWKKILTIVLLDFWNKLKTTQTQPTSVPAPVPVQSSEKEDEDGKEDGKEDGEEDGEEDGDGDDGEGDGDDDGEGDGDEDDDGVEGDEDEDEDDAIKTTIPKIAQSKKKPPPSFTNGDEGGDEDDLDEDDTIDGESRQDYLQQHHPEVIFPDSAEMNDIIASYSRSEDPVMRLSRPILSKYEATSVVGMRAQQIVQGSAPLIDAPTDDPIEIAQAELHAKIIPVIIRRILPNGTPEYWRLSELRYYG